MKKRIFLISVILIILAILASGTIAYYISEERVKNVITTGAVELEINEWQMTDNGLVPFDTNEPIYIVPGVSISRIATVKNVQAQAYIRARFDIVIHNSNNEVLLPTRQELDSMITVLVNESDWLRKEGDSEWWYYNSAVDTGASTEAFFTDIVFDGPNISNEYQNCTITVNVTAQAVQTANNEASVLQALGWPTE